jgi:hypothetical protein
MYRRWSPSTILHLLMKCRVFKMHFLREAPNKNLQKVLSQWYVICYYFLSVSFCARRREKCAGCREWIMLCHSISKTWSGRSLYTEKRMHGLQAVSSLDSSCLHGVLEKKSRYDWGCLDIVTWIASRSRGRSFHTAMSATTT